LITSRGRIKFTAFLAWQSFIFLQGKIACKFYPFASASLALTFLARFARAASAFFYASLAPKPSPFYARKCLKPHFAVKFRLDPAHCRADIAALRFSALISRREIYAPFTRSRFARQNF